MSDDFTFIGDGSVVHTGDVGANEIRDREKDDHHEFADHDDDVTVWFDEGSSDQQTSSRVVGATVRLDQKASIYNLVAGETINHSALVLGTTSAVTLSFMLMPAFPTVFIPSMPDVTVDSSATVVLSPGSYGRVRVLNGGTLKLSGGLYQVLTVELGGRGDHAEGDRDSGDGDDRHATVVFQAATEIRVKGLMYTDVRTQMILDPSVGGLKASQMVIFVAGTAWVQV